MEIESLKKIIAAIEKSICALDHKQELTPAETAAAKDGMELRAMLLCEIDDRKEMEEIEYSNRHGYSRGFSRPTSIMHSDRSYGYDGDYGIGGWYRSKDRIPPMYYDEGDRNSRYGSVSTADESYNRGMSRHSIGDRAVEKLELMMDNAGSDYEREQLKQFIRMIKAAAD